ncbi:unnamed protein product [Spirodela intermedia]|uniref:Uncharacterized protein n=1 Tax=Spirodela intermedia TaxID=51605 RepID=A0A7I8LH19_SPIIN|nr:unnamed protein product [Spirodela intermedia]
MAILFAVLLVMAVAAVAAGGDTNSKVVKISCGSEVALNATVFLPSLIANMDGTREQVRATGFGISTNGSDHSLALCYRGLPEQDCTLCYSTARTTLPQCFPYIGGRIYLDGCFMRAEKYEFYGEFSGPQDGALCGNATRRGAAFERAAREAVRRAVTAAPPAGGNATVSVPGGEPVYVLVDCWRSLNESSCSACLESALASVTSCLPWSEGRALHTGCFLRYSDANFLGGAEEGGSAEANKTAIIATPLAILALALFAVILIRICRKNMNQKREMEEAAKIASLLYTTCIDFKYSTLEKATGHLSESNKLGQGGFGAVYKGVLADGREIAVKRLFIDKRPPVSDFFNEANIISSLEHENLVRLLGCSCSGPENLLVYEYLPNQSLDRLLFHPIKGRELKWQQRFGIIVGVARGLTYLHENQKTRIIHRDIKASNILLDCKLRPKIADFGLARAFHYDQTHLNTGIAGTIGYMAPEYVAHGQLTEKVDVYSFGVLLLEIVTGRPNRRGETTGTLDCLLISAWKRFQMGRTEELIDPTLLPHTAAVGEGGAADPRGEIMRVAHVAHLCTQESPPLRPSASRALQMLLGKEERLPLPAPPPFADDGAAERNPLVRRSPSSSGSFIAAVSYSSLQPR